MTKEVKNYHKVCEELKDAFLNALYPEDKYPCRDAYWIGDDVGNLLSWGDWSVTMNDMADYFLYNYTPDEFLDWYDRKNTKGEMTMKMFKMNPYANRKTKKGA